jgi:hypothetical protein
MRATVVVLSIALPLVCGCGDSDRAGTSSRPPGPGDRSFGVRSDQPAGRSHLSSGDCARLARLVASQGGGPVRRSSEPSPPLSRCRLSGPGLRVSVYLDTAYAARQRYDNRMVEQVQFNAPDPARLPHHVARVGDPSAGEHYASWIPAYRTLFAVRGNRFLTVAYSAAGRSRRSSEAAAAALARRAFGLSAE